MVNLKDLTIEELQQCLAQLGEPKFRAKQIFSWLGRGAASFEQMTDLSKELRRTLAEHYYISKAEAAEIYQSKIDQTRKYLLKLMDGNMVECVAMYYKHGITICISCQVGCRMGCQFCASTIGGLVRSLTPGEMLDQIQYAQHDIGERISNIVMMGIGEPLDNYDNVIKFLRIVNHPDGMNIGFRHISLSTCGLVDNILRLADEGMPITLSISLHAPTNDIRNTIMPINHKYSIEPLLDACRKYIQKTSRRISFEYAMIKGVNDRPEHAALLADKLRGMLCHVNLIPVNPVKERAYQKPEQQSIRSFLAELERRGITATIRRELGSDISASCGQLRRAKTLESKG
mgnify:CR=1 FL=1